MKVRYFAWVRERVGHAEEEIDLPPGVASVADLIAVACRSATRAMPPPSPSRPSSAPRSTRSTSSTTRRCNGAREVAFFPPMTGG